MQNAHGVDCRAPLLFSIEEDKENNSNKKIAGSGNLTNII